MQTRKKNRVKKPQSKKKEDLVIAFDLGGTKLASAVVTLDGRILEEVREAVEFKKGKDGFINFLTQSALRLQKKYPSVKALGIGSCGPLDPEKGILLQPTNFPKWGDISIVAPLKKALKIPVAVQNDAAAAALAEGCFGSARKMRNWVVLTLGTGLGTGIVMNRKVFLGGSGLGPEAGHMIVTDAPYLCGCGNYGCAESVLSGTSLQKRIAERKLSYKNSVELVKGARKKEPKACEIFAEYAEVMARTIHNLAIMYKPEGIFLSGGLSEASDLFLKSTQEKLKPMLKGRPGFEPQISVSKLGNELGVLGGAYVGFEAIDLVSSGLKKD